jgi:hypothetical protein
MNTQSEVPGTAHHQPVPLPALDAARPRGRSRGRHRRGPGPGHAGDTSMIHVWFPVVLFWVTVAVCAIPVVLRRDVLHEFASRIPIGIVFAVLLFAGLTSPRAIPTGAPVHVRWADHGVPHGRPGRGRMAPGPLAPPHLRHTRRRPSRIHCRSCPGSRSSHRSRNPSRPLRRRQQVASDLIPPSIAASPR